MGEYEGLGVKYVDFVNAFNLGAARDRTNTFHDNTTRFPIPEYKQSDTPFNEIVDNRTLEYGDVTILFWDGSISGVLVISSFIKHNKPLNIFCNAYSACGYPRLFIDILNGVYPNVNLIYNVNFNLMGFVGTSSSGSDLLYGSILQGKETLYQTPYQEVLSGEEQSLFETISDKCPYKITTLLDVGWWIDFTQKWDDTFFKSSKFGGGTLEFTIDFFNCNGFQQWSIGDQGRSYRASVNSPLNHTLIEKEYICSVLKDTEYLNSKNIYAPYKLPNNVLGLIADWSIQRLKNNINEFTDAVQAVYDGLHYK